MSLLVTPFSSVMAQGFGDDSYDPFADYSEFEADDEEEADIHFFKNGRFFNMALMAGLRSFTGTLGELSGPAPIFGLYLAYFFDIRSAIQVSINSGNHDYSIASEPALSFNGFDAEVSMTSIAFHYKYYFNTSNITRGFADLNPFLMGGVGINFRDISVIGEDIVLRSDPTSFDFGAGIEIPVARNQMYIGLQALYHFVEFPDEGEFISDADPNASSVKPEGDYFTISTILGINF